MAQELTSKVGDWEGEGEGLSGQENHYCGTWGGAGHGVSPEVGRGLGKA